MQEHHASHGRCAPIANLESILRDLTSTILQVCNWSDDQLQAWLTSTKRANIFVGEELWRRVYDDRRLQSDEYLPIVHSMNLPRTVCKYYQKLNSQAARVSSDNYPKLYSDLLVESIRCLLSGPHTVSFVNESKYMLNQLLSSPSLQQVQISADKELMNVFPQKDDVKENPELIRYILFYHQHLSPQKVPEHMVTRLSELFRLVLQWSPSELQKRVPLWESSIYRNSRLDASFLKVVDSFLRHLVQAIIAYPSDNRFESAAGFLHIIEQIIHVFSSLFRTDPSIFRDFESSCTIQYLFENWDEFPEDIQLPLLTMTGPILEFQPIPSPLPSPSPSSSSESSRASRLSYLEVSSPRRVFEFLLPLFKKYQSNSFNHIITFLYSILNSNKSLVPLFSDIFLPSLLTIAENVVPNPPFDHLITLLNVLVPDSIAIHKFQQWANSGILRVLTTWINCVTEHTCLLDLFNLCMNCLQQIDESITSYSLKPISKLELRLYLLEHLLTPKLIANDLLYAMASEVIVSLRSLDISTMDAAAIMQEPIALVLSSADSHLLVSYSFLFDFIAKLSSFSQGESSARLLIDEIHSLMAGCPSLSLPLFPLVLGGLMGKLAKNVLISSDRSPSSFRNAHFLPLVSVSLIQSPDLLLQFTQYVEYQENLQFLSRQNFLSQLLSLSSLSTSSASSSSSLSASIESILSPLIPLIEMLFTQGLSALDLRSLLHQVIASTSSSRDFFFSLISRLVPLLSIPLAIPCFTVSGGSQSLQHTFRAGYVPDFTLFVWVQPKGASDLVLLQLNDKKVPMPTWNSFVSGTSMYDYPKGASRSFPPEIVDYSESPPSTPIGTPVETPASVAPSLCGSSFPEWSLVSVVYTRQTGKLTVTLNTGPCFREFDSRDFDPNGSFSTGRLVVQLCPPPPAARFRMRGSSLTMSGFRSCSRSLGGASFVPSSPSTYQAPFSPTCQRPAIPSLTFNTIHVPDSLASSSSSVQVQYPSTPTGFSSVQCDDDPPILNSVGLCTRRLSPDDIEQIYRSGPYNGRLMEVNGVPFFPDLWYLIPCTSGVSNLSFDARTPREDPSLIRVYFRSFVACEIIDSVMALGGESILYRLLHLCNSESSLISALSFVDGLHNRLQFLEQAGSHNAFPSAYRLSSPLSYMSVLHELLITQSSNSWFSNRCFSVIFDHFDCHSPWSHSYSSSISECMAASPFELTPQNVPYFYVFILNDLLCQNYSWSDDYLQQSNSIIASVFPDSPECSKASQIYLEFLGSLVSEESRASSVTTSPPLNTDPLLCFILSTGSLSLLPHLFRVYLVSLQSFSLKWSVNRFLVSVQELIQLIISSDSSHLPQLHSSIDPMDMQRKLVPFLVDVIREHPAPGEFSSMSLLLPLLSPDIPFDLHHQLWFVFLAFLFSRRPLVCSGLTPFYRQWLERMLQSLSSDRSELLSLLLHFMFVQDFRRLASMPLKSLPAQPPRLDSDSQDPLFFFLDSFLISQLLSILSTKITSLSFVHAQSECKSSSIDLQGAESASKYLFESLQSLLVTESQNAPSQSHWSSSSASLDTARSEAHPMYLFWLSREPFVHSVMCYYIYLCSLVDQESNNNENESCQRLSISKTVDNSLSPYAKYCSVIVIQSVLDYFRELFIELLLRNQKSEYPPEWFLDQVFGLKLSNGAPLPISLHLMYYTICDGFLRIVRSPGVDSETYLGVFHHFSEWGTQIEYYGNDLTVLQQLLLTRLSSMSLSPAAISSSYREFHDILVRYLRHLSEVGDDHQFQGVLLKFRAIPANLNSEELERSSDLLAPLFIQAFLSRTDKMREILLEYSDYLQSCHYPIPSEIVECFRSMVDHPSASPDCFEFLNLKLSLYESQTCSSSLCDYFGPKSSFSNRTPSSSGHIFFARTSSCLSDPLFDESDPIATPQCLLNFLSFRHAHLMSHGSQEYLHDFSKRYLHKNSPWGYDGYGSMNVASESEALHWKLDSVETLGFGLHYRLKRNLNPLLPESSDFRFVNQMLVHNQIDLSSFSVVAGREMSYSLLQYLFFSADDWISSPPHCLIHSANPNSDYLVIRSLYVRRLESYCGILIFTHHCMYFVYNMTYICTCPASSSCSSSSASHHFHSLEGSPQWHPCSSQHKCLRIDYSSVHQLIPTRYNLLLPAVTFKEDYHRPHFFVFPDAINSRSVLWSVFQRFCPLGVSSHLPAPEYNRFLAGSYYRHWRHRELTNLEYLILLNDVSGRSNIDLFQYPVFPWVLRDYASVSLDLSNHQSYRDLSLPVGCLSKKRQSEFVEKFKSMQSQYSSTSSDSDLVPFVFGSHYSNKAYTYHYLIRLEPYGSGHFRFQGNRFDVADRLFFSMDDSWMSCSEVNNQDVRELIPEFFYLPEFFVNSNHYRFGVSQTNTVVNDVLLPLWSDQNPYWFVYNNRRALESPKVTSHLSDWVDLIFGRKQSGPLAMDSLNVFGHMTYEVYKEREMKSVMLSPNGPWTICLDPHYTCYSEYGEIPLQLFVTPHPMKKSRTHQLSVPGFRPVVMLSASSSSSSPSAPLSGACLLSLVSRTKISVRQLLSSEAIPPPFSRFEISLSSVRLLSPSQPVTVQTYCGIRIVFGFPNGLFKVESPRSVVGTVHYYTQDHSRVTCVDVDCPPRSSLLALHGDKPPLMFVVGTSNGSLEVYRSVSESNPFVLTSVLSGAHCAPLRNVAVSSYLSQCLSLDDSGKVLSWCLSRGIYLREIPTQLPTAARGLSLMQQSARLVVFDSSHVQLLNLNAVSLTCAQQLVVVGAAGDRIECALLLKDSHGGSSSSLEDVTLIVALASRRVDFYGLQFRKCSVATTTPTATSPSPASVAFAEFLRVGSQCLPLDSEASLRSLSVSEDSRELFVMDSRSEGFLYSV